jgi:hypothetical protein
LVLDKETGKPNKNGFCEYKDEEIALEIFKGMRLMTVSYVLVLLKVKKMQTEAKKDQVENLIAFGGECCRSM